MWQDLRLDAAQREHEAARRVAPVRAEREHARHVEAGHYSSARSQPDFVAQADADEAVVRQHQAFSKRRADVIDEFERRRARSALRAVDDDEVRANPGFDHRLADGHELPWMADAKLETNGLAVGQLTKPRDEMHHLDRRVEGRVARRRNAIDADRDAARFGDLGGNFGAGQNAAVTRLCALRELDFDHLHLGGPCLS